MLVQQQGTAKPALDGTREPRQKRMTAQRCQRRNILRLWQRWTNRVMQTTQ